MAKQIPTSTAIPSAKVEDIRFNAQTLDEIINDDAKLISDRFSRQIPTIREFYNNLGYILIQDFNTGATLTKPNEALLWDAADGGDGEYYRWDGALPKAVAPASTPATSGGVGAGFWLGVGEAALRSELAQTDSQVSIAGETAERVSKKKAFEFLTIDDLLNADWISVGDRCNTDERTAGNGGGGEYTAIATGVTPSVDLPDGYSIIQSVADPLISFVLRIGEHINVSQLGAKGLGVDDEYSIIEAAFSLARSSGRRVYFPINPANGTSVTIYLHSQTLSFDGTAVIFEGESTKVQLKYTGTGTGVAGNLSALSPQRERCGFSNISLVSTTGAVGFDFTGINYGSFHDFEINYTAPGAKLIYASGSSGNGPYFNSFDAFSLIGGDRSQIGIEFNKDASGNLAPGPNANVISNLKRAAALSRGVNLIAGTGNMFSNVGFESISDAAIVFNDVPSYADSGTATSTTSSTLVDTTKTWSVVAGDPLNFINDCLIITNGTYAGITRRITSNTATTLILDKPFPANMGTPTYQIADSLSVKNLFVNVRQEGLSSDNPDCIRFMAGARGNEISQIEAGSLGSGETVDDQTGDPSNKAKQGELVCDTFIVENIGPSANLDVVPRSSVYGGIRAGSSMVLEYIEMQSPNFVVGSAEAILTVDHGGASVGTGTVASITATIDDFNSKETFRANLSKNSASTTNNGIFVNLQTNANVNAAADFIIKVVYRVL